MGAGDGVLATGWQMYKVVGSSGLRMTDLMSFAKPGTGINYDFSIDDGDLDGISNAFEEDAWGDSLMIDEEFDFEFDCE
jgi:hypothetical protein